MDTGNLHSLIALVLYGSPILAAYWGIRLGHTKRKLEDAEQELRDYRVAAFRAGMPIGCDMTRSHGHRALPAPETSPE